MSEKKEIKITAAKGRPMLSWVGKRPLRYVTSFPAQQIESFAIGDERQLAESAWERWPEAYPKSGLLFHGDNKEVLAHLLANGFRGQVKLIYIDPPFDSGADYVRKVQLRGGAATAKIEGENYTLGEQIQYTDIWANDNYLQFMYERLLLLKELLHENGSIFVHLDTTKVHYLKILMDEIYGPDNFRNEIVWRNTNSHNSATMQFGPIHQNILFYSKTDKFTLHAGKCAFTAGYIKERFKYEDKNGIYQPNYITGPGLRAGESGMTWRGFNPSVNGRHWAIPSNLKEMLPNKGNGLSTQQLLEALLEADLLIIPKKTGGQPMYKQYMTTGTPYQDLWCYQSNTQGTLYNSNDCIDEDVKWLEQEDELEGYPTQKPEGLLKRIIESVTNSNDLILDCFIGSGTTAAISQKLGRRWIGCDINKGAIQTTAKRLQSIIKEQSETINNAPTDMYTPEMHEKHVQANEFDAFCPLCLTESTNSFTLWRVNDYDLKIQRNEAIKLACEHIGVERIPSDSYFDGKLGKKLVKITPFEHPLSPIDLEEMKRELDTRPEVENTIVFVCLGIELAARTWIDDWNRLRKGENTVNKIEVIELRTDAKYGNFIKHEPATAKVSIMREDDKISVSVEDFISPTILKRLDMDIPLFKAKITDWRSQVDCLMIDTSYDGMVFNVALTDVPEKKNDLIVGSYTLPAPADVTTVAVKIIDMLGEEVLITEEV